MLEISDLKAWRLREPVSKRTYTVVKVQAGPHSGYGESGAGAAEQVERAKKIVLKREATAYEAIRRDLASLTAIQSAIDIALLDIIGRYSKAPVYQVLGGPTRNKVRAMAMLDGADSLASMKAAQAQGYRAFSVPLPQVGARNQGRAFVDAVKKRMDALRAAGGEDVDFVLDGGGALSPGDS
jgi:galactonate dehydratase